MSVGKITLGTDWFTYVSAGFYSQSISNSTLY